jgi:hypothetical protein
VLENHAALGFAEVEDDAYWVLCRALPWKE